MIALLLQNGLDARGSWSGARRKVDGPLRRHDNLCSHALLEAEGAAKKIALCWRRDNLCSHALLAVEMADALLSPRSLTDFSTVTAKNMKDQCIFFLNAFWTEFGEEAEWVWQLYQKMVLFDEEYEEPKKSGCDVHEFPAHRVLEYAYSKPPKALTNKEKPSVAVLRKIFKEEIDLDNNGRLAPVELLVYMFLRGKFPKPVEELMKRPQGTNAELEKAQKAVEEVQAEIDRIEALKKKFQDVVSDPQSPRFKKSQAQVELDQIMAGDTTELNRRQITAQAAVRKAQKLGGADAQGGLFWVGRDLEEAAKYKPSRGKK